MPTALVTHLLEPDPSGVAHLFAADARFSSPFADYAGRERISGLFAVMPQVFDALEPRRELTGADASEVATVLHGRIGEHAMDAVLDERYAADGTVAEVMVLIRPLPAVKEAVRRMGRLLGAADPGEVRSARSRCLPASSQLSVDDGAARRGGVRGSRSG